MNCLRRFLCSSIVKKQIMAITGLLLVGFLLGHLSGNVLIIVSKEAFNKYAHALVSNPMIYLAEAILLAIFLKHMGLAFKLTFENKRARGVNYHIKRPTGRGATFASSTMIYSGSIILVFLVLHIIHFKFGSHYEIEYDGLVIRDLHRTVIEYFANPLHVVWYVLSMSCLGIHLSHGIQSAFQSLGINHKSYNSAIMLAGRLLSALFALGFSTLAIWSHFQGA